MKNLLDRRKFLKGGLASGVLASVLGTGKKASAEHSFEGYPDSMGVLVDLSKCIGCRTCEAACNKEQELPAPDKPFDDMSVFDEIRHARSAAPRKRPTPWSTVTTCPAMTARYSENSSATTVTNQAVSLPVS